MRILNTVWLVALLANMNTLPAQEVVYFRHDFGVAKDSKPLPSNFENDAKQLWRALIPPGHSTPCVCGDAIYLTTFQADEQELATVALDRATGELRWRQVVPTKSFEPVHATGSTATSSPACNGKQVFAFFGSYGMLCYDLQGKLLWERKLGPFQDEFGAASSPILVDDKVILNEDHDINSFMIALDQKNGEVVWKVERNEATRSYSTPFVLEREGKKQILIAGSLQLAAYDPATGEKLWWYNGISRIVDSTPVIHNGMIYVATWTPGGDPGERITMEPFGEAISKFDKNTDKMISQEELPKDSPVLDRFFRIDLNQNKQLEEDEWKRHAVVFERAQNVAVALEPGSRGALTPQYVRWTHERGLPTVPSSVVFDGVLTMVKDSGIVTILDIADGKMLHQIRAEGRGNYYASLVAGDGKVYLTSESGVITILESGKSGKILSSHDFGERVMASPVVSGGVMYIRTEGWFVRLQQDPVKDQRKMLVETQRHRDHRAVLVCFSSVFSVPRCFLTSSLCSTASDCEDLSPPKCICSEISIKLGLPASVQNHARNRPSLLGNRTMSTHRLLRSAFIVCLTFSLFASNPGNVHGEATLASATPLAIEPSKTTRVVLTGTAFSAPLRVWTSCEAQVAVVSVEPTQATLDITPAAGVALGSMGLWVATAEGPTDAINMLIDDLPSVVDNAANHQREQAQAINPMCGVDGTSDGPLSDYYRIHALAGQRIAFEVHAQRIGSSMDPVVRLLDAAGKPVLLIDDEEGCPDSRFAYDFKQEGDYFVEVFDSRFAAGGRYRLRVGDFPIVSASMPMAAQLGSRVQCAFVGQDAAKIPAREVEIPTAYPYATMNIAVRFPDGKSSAWVPMLLRTGAQVSEPVAEEQGRGPWLMPVGISGRLTAANESDSFQLTGVKGQGGQFTARTRSLGMPTMLQMQLFNAAGAKVAESAVSDSDEWSFNFTFPEDGVYRLAVNDLLHRGGAEFGYLVEVAPIPTFSVALKADAKVKERFAIELDQGAAAIDVQVARTGYEGAIDVAFAVPVAGLEILNPRIDAKAKESRLYLTASKDWNAEVFKNLQLVATAVDTPNLKVAVDSTGLHRIKRPTMPYPPAWIDGGMAIAGVVASPAYFAFEPAAPIAFARAQRTHTAPLTLKRTQEAFKEAVTVLPYRQANQWTAAAKPDKDTYTVTWTRDAEAGQLDQVSLLTYSEFNGRGRLQSQSIPVAWFDPLKVTIKAAGVLVAGMPQKIQVDLEWAKQAPPQPVKLTWQNLPAGWSGAAVDVPADQKSAIIDLVPSADFAAASASVQLLATTTYAGQPLNATSDPTTFAVIAAPTKLEVFPTALQLNNSQDIRRLVITGVDAAGNLRDWTRDCKITSSNPAVVRVELNKAIPVADGTAELIVEAGVVKQTVSVQVANVSKPHATQFENDVLVALSKQGCNSGACHGSPSGKGGFRLSLRAFDKQLDQLTLLREEFGRRVNPLEPEKSLLLLKPLMKVGHGGGMALHKHDPAYEVLRNWIAEGAKLDPPETARCVKLEIYPSTKRVLNRVVSPTQQLTAIAHFSDGTTRDMTHLVAYETSNTSVAEVSTSGLVTSRGRGEAAILVRYLEHIESVPIMFVEDVPGFQWQAPTPNNFVDELVNAKLQQLQYLPSPTADDSEFLRRVYLDVIGLLPTLEETKAYLADANPEKRKMVIDRLLERPEHAKFWALKWGDLLRMTGKSVGDEGVYKYNRWVEEAIRENMPYDEFAKALVTASGSTLSNPPANFYRTAGDTNDCVETISQVFLGARLQCAKCHNHPFERWTQDNYYGLGAFFNRIQRKKTQRPGEMFVYTSTSGDVTQPRTGQLMKPWLPQVGSIDAANENDRRTDFAAWLVSPENPYFAKIEANRIWSQVFSRGIVDPIDDFRDSNPPSNAPLLDALAKAFVSNKFDRRHLLRVILNSRTYQASYRTNPFNQDDTRYFSHQEPRLLSAEQLLDAVNQTTGTQQTFGSLPPGTKATQLPAPDLVKVDFLKVFGQPERSTVCACERAEDSNLAMAIELFNGPMIYERLRDANNRFRRSLAANVSLEDTVRELYLAALCRQPTDAELTTAVEHSKTRGDAASALEDICWALLNTDEFLFQH